MRIAVKLDTILTHSLNGSVADRDVESNRICRDAAPKSAVRAGIEPSAAVGRSQNHEPAKIESHVVGRDYDDVPIRIVCDQISGKFVATRLIDRIRSAGGSQRGLIDQ